MFLVFLICSHTEISKYKWGLNRAEQPQEDAVQNFQDAIQCNER